jgi:probable F420-dependent oxidoreductase
VATGRALRFGVQVGRVTTRAELVDTARRAEAAGFDILQLPDHLGEAPVPLIPLATVAEATTELRVGTLVLNNDFRHPVLVARDVAALDVVTDGRVELGIGAGHARPEYESIGLAFDPAPERVGRLEEAAPILRRLLDGETVTHDGAHYHLDQVTCWPRPVQERVPLLIGGNGTRVLRLAGRVADIVGLTGLGPTLADGQRHRVRWSESDLADRLDQVRAGAGARFDSLELSVLVQVVDATRDRRAAAAALVEHVDGLTVDDALSTPYLLLGTPADIADQIRSHRDRWGISSFTTRVDSIDVMAEVIGLVPS